MRKIIIVTVLMMAVSVFAKDKGEGPIAVLNMATLVQAYPGTESSEAVLRGQVKEFEAEKEDMMKKLEEKQVALQAMAKQSDDPALSDAAIAKKRVELEKEMVHFRQYRQDIMERLKLRQQQIGDEKRRLQKRIFDELAAVVEKHSKKKGYSLVIDTSALIYRNEGIDITDDILKLLKKEKKD